METMYKITRKTEVGERPVAPFFTTDKDEAREEFFRHSTVEVAYGVNFQTAFEVIEH